MRRMTGFDAQFVFDERLGEPQHTLKLAFLDAAASRGFDVAAAQRLLAERLPRLDPLRWRVAKVPLDLHPPVCLGGGPPALDWHVRRAAVPAPGGRDELCELVSQIASAPLDSERPLWELSVVEGFEGDKVVLVLKLSHALADGGESRILLERMFGPASEEARLPAAETTSRLRLALGALRDWPGALAMLVGVARRTIENAWRGRRRSLPKQAADRLAPTRMRSPRTGFGGPLGPRRAFHYQTLPLAEARSVSKAFGCTLNEVLIATVAGGVRRYLREHRHLPGLATIGHMPLSTRSEAEIGSWGCSVVTLDFALPTHIEDPVVRLRAAARENARVKAAFAAQRGGMLEDWQNALPPLFTRLFGAFARTFARLRPKVSGGVVVSNVRGPSEALAVAGGAVENLVSVGHVKWVSGLNVTTWSYAGNLNLGLYASAESFSDLGRLSALLAQSFEELTKAAQWETSRLAGAGEDA